MGNGADTEAADAGQACDNCGAALTAPYCGQCGQRRVGEGERRLGHLFEQFVSSATHIDSRFWRTFIALLFRPGRLTRDYIDGRRTRWLGPVTVFLLVNLIYFLAPALTDLNLPFRDQVPGHIGLQTFEDPDRISESYREYLENWNGQIHSPLTAPLLERRVERRNADHLRSSGGERGYTMLDYARAYEARNSEVSKLLIGLHIPFLALGLAVLFWRKKLYFAEHVVAALHLFSFMVLLQQVLVWPAAMIAHYWPWFAGQFSALMPFSPLLILVYTAIALRRIYRSPWWWCAAGSLMTFLALAVTHLAIYRPVQFLTVFALT